MAQPLDPTPRQSPSTAPQQREKPLQSWKEIAAYLERDSRTARRWEKTHGLPVRRHGDSSRASVYAYPSELDAWRAAKPPKAALELQGTARPRLSPFLLTAAMVLVAVLVVLRGPILSPSDPLAEAADRTGMAVRLVMDDPDGGVIGTISTDGRYLSCADWKTGNAGICDLSTGEKKILTKYGDWNAEGAWDKSGFTDLNIIAPDGEQIAFTYYTASRSPDAKVELRVMNSDGTGEHALYSKSPYRDGGWIIPDAWSSDGKQILARVHLPEEQSGPPSRGGYALVLVSTEDKTVTTLWELRSTRRYRRRTFLSRDDRYVAYDFPPNEQVSDGDVFILSVENKQPIPVAPHPADDYGLGWTPDGKTLLFASNRSGSYGIWSIPVEDGKPQGEPTLLRPHVGEIKSAGFDDKGTLYYTLASEPTNAFSATLDPETGKATDKPKLFTDRFSGSHDWAAWSPDGSQVAYRSWQGPSDQSSMKISIRSLKEGSEREVVPQLAEFSNLAWHASGESLLVLGRPQTAPTKGLYQVDAHTGATQLLLAESDFAISGWTNEGSEVILLFQKPSRFVSHNLVSGSDKTVYELPEGYQRMFSGGLSPDGTMLAVSQMQGPSGGALILVSTESGEVREIYSYEKGVFMNYNLGLVAWAPDNRALYLGIRGEGRIVRLAVGGGEPVETGLIREVFASELPVEELDARRLSALSVSPDGRKISFSFREKSEFGLWVFENFLPDPRQTE